MNTLTGNDQLDAKELTNLYYGIIGNKSEVINNDTPLPNGDETYLQVWFNVNEPIKKFSLFSEIEFSASTNITIL